MTETRRKFLKPKQVAEMFGVNYCTALRWAKAGKFGAFKVQNQWFFVKSALPPDELVEP